MTPLPRIDHWLMNGFEHFFLPRYLRKHFHAIAVQRASLTDEVHAENSAVVLYANHASWWDPLVGMFVHRHLFAENRLYAPIDASALARYPIFSRMGFYGIEQQSHRGAAEFLRRSVRIAREPGATIALTPEGKFCDVRDQHQRLMPGLAHLATAIEAADATRTIHSRCVWFVPAAIEYCFWEERLPECLCWVGSPVRVEWGRATANKSAWDRDLTSRLRAAQQALAAASIARDESMFELLLSGRAGTWSPYDAVRRFLARLRRRRVPLEHGEKFSSRRTDRAS